MNFHKKMVLASVVASIGLFSSASAQDLVYSGFMTDYSQLRKIEDGSADYRYIAPGALEKLHKYNAVMIDEPEIFVANDSPYRGVKAKQLDALAEGLRGGIAQALADDVYVVDRPGENVMYMRVAASNVRMTKKKKSLLGYTPIGLVSGAVRGAATTKIAKKADLRDAVIEIEVFDSVTEERLAAFIDHSGSGKENPSSWEELDERMALYGTRLQCRLRNAKLPEDQQVDCLSR